MRGVEVARGVNTYSAESLEQRLWDSADALRGCQESSEYKHVVLGRVFLKYISDRFEERRRAIEASLSELTTAGFANLSTRVVTW
jgi:type I restriction enzyme M protein